VEENGIILYVVEVLRDITERVRTEHELEERTAELMAANKMLSKIAITDGLTELYNRRHFDEILSKEIKRYARKKYSSLTLMMADIDHFKRLNDKHGHLVGDEVLREVATLLREGVRATDMIARYGGEEFAIVLPDTPLDGAEHTAEKIRMKVAEKEFPGQNGPVHITISIGVTAFTTGSAEDFVRAADSALYEAKRGGRNRVVVPRPEP
jgi:diguanylate cyclase (GGDEF)-like protein